MPDQFTDLLSDYLDSELASDERARIEAHLDGCDECRMTLSDLRAVAARAAALADTPPDIDLWPDVATRIGALANPGESAPQAASVRTIRPAARRISFTVPQLVAAGLALMLLSGGTAWLGRMGGSRTDFEPVAAQDDSRVQDARALDVYYDQAIADLQKTLDAGRGRLDPETVRVLESSLQAIDDAIEQCRRALVADPSSVYLNTHLANAQRRKLMLLRRATALAAAQS
jgi:tetratricopeptide (TPR) repeat protein